MMYLGPTLRRDFLDTVLKHSFPEYSDILKKYKTILKNRNKDFTSLNILQIKYMSVIISFEIVLKKLLLSTKQKYRKTLLKQIFLNI